MFIRSVDTRTKDLEYGWAWWIECWKISCDRFCTSKHVCVWVFGCVFQHICWLAPSISHCFKFGVCTHALCLCFSHCRALHLLEWWMNVSEIPHTQRCEVSRTALLWASWRDHRSFQYLAMSSIVSQRVSTIKLFACSVERLHILCSRQAAGKKQQQASSKQQASSGQASRQEAAASKQASKQQASSKQAATSVCPLERMIAYKF